jgi:SOS-response transcriptional repressor LexA
METVVLFASPNLPTEGGTQASPENDRNVVFAARIAALASKLTLSQSDIARRLGVKPQSVQQWFAGDTVPRTQRLEALAGLLKTSVRYLLGGPPDSGEGNTSFPESPVTEIPLISWVQAGQWACAEDPYPVGAAERMIRTFETVGESAFGLRVQGDSMEPTFPAGCIIIVDPSRDARNGSYVVVRLDDSTEATFKQLIFDGPVRYLKPLNPRYPIMQINSDTTVCGVVVGLQRSFD